VNALFWKNRRVLITGHTGFKGSWLSLWLQQLNAHLCGISLEPTTTPNLFSLADVAQHMKNCIADVREFSQIKKIIHDFEPEIIIHMAAQPLVRYSYHNPIETYSTNVMGTAYVLEAAKTTESVKAVVNVTTDKCYENKEWMWGYRENENVGGEDPYSSSKACSELVTTAYQKSYFQKLKKGLASARAGNVIGGGDWSQDRLIPDIINSIIENRSVVIRNPNAIRPWQHVLEPLFGYLLLAEKLFHHPDKLSGAWNFGPFVQDAMSVEKIIKKMFSVWPEKNRGYLIEQDKENLHEAHYLKLDTTKAMNELKWKSQLDIDATIAWISTWYQAWMNKKNMREITIGQIKQYEKLVTQE